MPDFKNGPIDCTEFKNSRAGVNVPDSLFDGHARFGAVSFK